MIGMIQGIFIPESVSQVKAGRLCRDMPFWPGQNLGMKLE